MLYVAMSLRKNGCSFEKFHSVRCVIFEDKRKATGYDQSDILEWQLLQFYVSLNSGYPGPCAWPDVLLLLFEGRLLIITVGLLELLELLDDEDGDCGCCCWF